MYSGTQTSGKSRASNASRSGKKRRRGRRRKNPSPTTYILIAGASAAALGGGIAYALYRRKKKQQQLPPVPSNGGGRPSGGGGGRPSGGGSRVNAPAFPYSDSEARQVEAAWVTTVFTEAMNDAGVGVPITRSLDALADDAFYEMYKIQKIPASSQRGTGWDPYIASWKRIRATMAESVGAYNSGLASA